MSTSQTKEFESSLKIKKLMEENKSQNSVVEHYEIERKELLNKYNQHNEEVQKFQSDKIEDIEKQNKEKNNALKKKIVDLKNIISNLEDQLKDEKNNFLNEKNTYSKLINTMQEDLSKVKGEWEKKCKMQEVEFNELFKDLENHKNNEILTLKKEHQVEYENIKIDLYKYKLESESLKNFDREYIKISKHKELMEEEICELRKKHLVEIKKKGDEVDLEVKKRLFKLDEDKKTEYEFLTENLKKTIKNMEHSNEEIKKNYIDLEIKFKQVKESKDILTEKFENNVKLIKNLSNQVEDKKTENMILK